jgi:phosphatidylglycerophosphatase C
MSPSHERVVLFDFDGTLVRGDSVGHYLRHHLLARGPLRRLVALLALPLLLPLFLWWRSAWIAAGFYGWLGSVGRDDAMLERTRAAWLDGSRAARDKVRIEPAIARLCEHLARGERVIVVTGAETGIARALWCALDGPEVEFVGSSVRRGFGGHVPAEHCVGPRKLAALARLGVHPPFLAMYSDSARDLPLLLAARRAVMVEPRGTDLRRVQRRLPAVEVLR